MKNRMFKKFIVTGLASAICIGGATAMDLSSPTNTYVTSSYAATIKDTAFSATGTINSNVSMRKGPGTSYTRLSTLKKGVKVTIVAKSSNSWYKIKNGNNYAYVYSTYVTIGSKPNENQNETAYSATGVTKVNLSVRKSASASSTKLATLAKNTKVTIVAKTSNGWYKIKYNNGYAYVSSQYITISSKPVDQNKYPASALVNHDVYVRKGANTSYTKLGTLRKNTKITVLSKTTNGWYKVKYGTGYGYAYGQYITVSASQK
ncbi:MAG: SH3 domain-containing protein [Terrisporobacter sp.]|uniref:SH3 domain-containing protein n=1 Tax=Terrisporobacter sp. TaxID=1965305 RepID=UPI002FC7FD31